MSGVQDPSTIDLVTFDGKLDEVVLVAIEERVWDSSLGMLKELQAKVNNYLAFALDGDLERNYPAYSDKSIRLRLESRHPLDAASEAFVSRLSGALREHNVGFELSVWSEN